MMSLTATIDRDWFDILTARIIDLLQLLFKADHSICQLLIHKLSLLDMSSHALLKCIQRLKRWICDWRGNVLRGGLSEALAVTGAVVVIDMDHLVCSLELLAYLVL